MKDIDTKACSVYVLTGEYDWSNTPAISQATCGKIPGEKHQARSGLGRFPAVRLSLICLVCSVVMTLTDCPAD